MSGLNGYNPFNHIVEYLGTGVGFVAGGAAGIGLMVLASPGAVVTGTVIGGVGGATAGAVVGRRVDQGVTGSKGTAGTIIGGAAGGLGGAALGVASVEGGILVGCTAGGTAIGNFTGRKIDQGIDIAHDYIKEHGLGNLLGIKFRGPERGTRVSA